MTIDNWLAEPYECPEHTEEELHEYEQEQAWVEEFRSRPTKPEIPSLKRALKELEILENCPF